MLFADDGEHRALEPVVGSTALRQAPGRTRKRRAVGGRAVDLSHCRYQTSLYGRYLALGNTRSTGHRARTGGVPTPVSL